MAKMNVKTEKMMIKKAVIKKVASYINGEERTIYFLKVNRRRYYALKKLGIIGMKVKTTDKEEFYVRVNPFTFDSAEYLKESDFLNKRYIDINFRFNTIDCGKFKDAYLSFCEDDISKRIVTSSGTMKVRAINGGIEL